MTRRHPRHPQLHLNLPPPSPSLTYPDTYKHGTLPPCSEPCQGTAKGQPSWKPFRFGIKASVNADSLVPPSQKEKKRKKHGSSCSKHSLNRHVSPAEMRRRAMPPKQASRRIWFLDPPTAKIIYTRRGNASKV